MLSYLCLCLGLIVARLWQVSNLTASAIFVISFLISVIYIFQTQKITWRYYGFCLALVLLGFSYTNLRVNYRLNNLISEPISSLSLTGYLSSPPSSVNSELSQATFTITKGSYKNINLQIYYPEAIRLTPGYNYTFNASIRPLSSMQNFDAFNYADYQISQNISGSAMVKPNSIVQNKISYQFGAQISRIRSNLIDYMSITLVNYKYTGLAIAMVTGYQKLIPAEQWSIFQNSGITHIVSISGLHITLVVGLVLILINYALRFLPPTPIPKQVILAWCGVLVALFYSLIAGFSIPCQRTFYLILVIAYLSTRRIYLPLLKKLAITLAIVLLIDPFASSSIGFWFSFSLVATIFAMSTIYQRYSSKLKFFLHLHLAILLVSLPLSLYLFQTYPVVSVLANLWAIPVLGNIFTPLLLASSLLHISYLLKFAGYILDYAMLPIEFFAKFPPYWQSKPDWITLIICYFGVILFLLPIKIRYKNILAGALIISLFMVNPFTRPTWGNYQISAFANPKVSYNLIQTKSQTLLFMNSEESNTQAAQLKFTILPYLKAHHITKIDYILSNYPAEAKQVSTELSKSLIDSKEAKFTPQMQFDGIEWSYFVDGKIQTLVMQNNKNATYIGNGQPPEDRTRFQNIIVGLPQLPLTWLFQNPATNLIINYSNKQKMKLQALINNLNLPIKNVYDLNQQGSIYLDSEGKIIQISN